MKICFLDNSIIPYTYNDLNSKHNILTEKQDLHVNFESVETTRGRAWGIPKYA